MHARAGVLVMAGRRLELVTDAMAEPPIPLIPRPRTRGDCEKGIRPCPWVSCRHHLAVEVRKTVTHPRVTDRLSWISRIRYSPDQGVKQLFEVDPDTIGDRETCSLDVADGKPLTLRQIAKVFGLTRERVRQIEERALEKIGKHKWLHEMMPIHEPRLGVRVPDGVKEQGAVAVAIADIDTTPTPDGDR